MNRRDTTTGLLVALTLVGGCMRHSGRLRLMHRHEQQRAVEQEPATFPQLEPVSNKSLGNLNTPQARKRIAKAAAKAVGKRGLRVKKQRYRPDCSGTVRAIYAQAGIDLGGRATFHGENDVSVLYRAVKEQGGALHRDQPLPGDLLFFNATHDRSGNGLFDDPLTHVGVVEKVLKDGTVVFVHHLRNSIVRSRMNPQHPRWRRHPKTKQRLNHELRRESRVGESATTGQLFAAYGRVPQTRANRKKQG
ncbi:MAG: NlpC/P60 family protein [Myxococcota bacterium]